MELHHVGWAVHSLEASLDHFSGQLRLQFEGIEEFPTLKVAFFRAGATLIELLEPTSAEDDVATFLESRGEGIHHFAYAVSDVARELAEAEGLGMVPIDRAPRPGARGTVIGFADPGREDRILVEYVQDGDSQ